MHNFINIQLVNRLQIPAKNIQDRQVKGEHAQIFKYLKLSMDKYVLHSYFYAIDMDEVDIVLGYPWMATIGTININVENKFLKLWYKKKKMLHCMMYLLVSKKCLWWKEKKLFKSLKHN
jgi:hypothetical protein